MIECLCPHCKSEIEADDAYAGESVECPSCHKEFKVPAMEGKTEDFGVCPECKSPLQMPDAVICINCGHRLREIPVDTETINKRRKLRLRIFFTILASLLIPSVIFFMPIIIGIPVFVIIAGTVPGLWGAMLAKMIRLNASVKTGLLACGLTLLIVFAMYGYLQWMMFDKVERQTMLYSLLENPENAEKYPDSPLKAETVEVAKKIAATDKKSPDYYKFYSAEFNKLKGKYETHRFPFRWKLHELIERQSEYLWTTIFWLIGLNFFNLFCAFFFGKIPGAFSRVTNYKIQWDMEIIDEENFNIEEHGDSRFVMAVAVVVINSLVASSIYCLFCHILGRSLWKVLLLIFAISMIPAVLCLIKCENLKARLILLGLSVFCAGIMLLILFP